MQRLTISVDEELSAQLDEMLRARGYQSRSEGMRDLVRGAVEKWRDERRDSPHCVANLSYVYNRLTRSLAHRLSELQHEHHDLITATTQMHLDHDHSLESVLLRGPTAAVQALADQLRAERGVRFGMLNLVAVDPGDRHDHAHSHTHTGHAHLSPPRG